MNIYKPIQNNIRIKISLAIIILVGLAIRIFYSPFDLPLIVDSIDNFTYATAINYYGHLPTEWTPINNGWPIFLSFWFSVINLENTIEYMQLQRSLAIVLSVLITIPVFFLCRKFFDDKIALVGSALFIFDPRIILNSTTGITEPLFILSSITSLVIFLKYDRKWILLSFALAACCTIVRSEGMFLFITLTILFLMKYKVSSEILKTYVPSLIIFMLILIPIMDYRIEVAGYDGIFQRAAIGTGEIISMTNQEGGSDIFSGVELFVKYLGWIMIPTFLVFLPVGFILFFKNQRKDMYFVYVFLIVSSLPILYAYIAQAQDTRYLYILYPIFALISLFAVKAYISKISKKNLVLFLIILGIFVSSISFYEYKKIDFDKEREYNEIAMIVTTTVSGVNFHHLEAPYIRAAQVPNEWPFDFPDEKYKIKIIQAEKYDNIEEYISDSRKELTHLLVDDHSELPVFLKNVYKNEENYEYLDKEFDSKKMGFNYEIKLFEIDYEKFDEIHRE